MHQTKEKIIMVVQDWEENGGGHQTCAHGRVDVNVDWMWRYPSPGRRFLPSSLSSPLPLTHRSRMR